MYKETEANEMLSEMPRVSQLLIAEIAQTQHIIVVKDS
jgi:hypothetical protein